MGDILEFTHDKDECSPQIHMDEDDGVLCPVCESETLTEALMIQGSKWRAERVQTRHIMGQLIDCLKHLEEACLDENQESLDSLESETWQEMQMGEVLIRAETWMKDNPEVKIV